ncbi:agmatine deiminase [Bacterioplanes sanyensis]|uniref:Agmatine deiminase n=1 Tax=Bacterioplanes sanyensis TaxID=1249553 RepID=A0A222FML6_9GAMM|nr:agmatine deiminase family protein [Bacterioplanes sanyensis]ASP39989.1 agmatine deiminase [Bacterioplanes sanyensis]
MPAFSSSNAPGLRRMPAEWEPQCAMQLTWPHADSDWGPHLARVEPVFHAIVAAACRQQAVIIACHDQALKTRLQRHYQQQPNVHCWLAASNDTWARDHGPISCYNNGQLQLHDFVFNGWGNKYDCTHDNAISQQLAEQGAYPVTELQPHSLVLEGGSLESDGQGTLLTTEQCLLNPNRNPDLTRAELEQRLQQTLGFERVLWLAHGHLEGDDTDAHIDTLARFASPNTIVYSQAERSDEHWPSLHAMEQELQAMRQHSGEPYQLIPLPLPEAQFNGDGERLPATYANFLIINQAVLAPIYGVEQDQAAIEALARAFPQHLVVPINCRPIIEQFGSLHCLTMQIHTQEEHPCR